MPIKIDLYDYQRFHKSIPHRSNYPVITNVAISSIGVVTWTTDVPSTSQVFYGVVPYLGFQTDEDLTYVTSHSVKLQGLTLGQPYYLRVESFNLDALSISDLYSFTFIETATTFVLQSPDGTFWSVNPTPLSGDLDSEIIAFGILLNVVLTDAHSINWAVTINNNGNLITSAGGDPSVAVPSMFLLDSTNTGWILTVSTNGNLITT